MSHGVARSGFTISRVIHFSGASGAFIYAAIIGWHDDRRPLIILRDLHRRARAVYLFDPCPRHWKWQPDLGIVVRKVQKDDQAFGRLCPGWRRFAAEGNDTFLQVRLIEVVEEITAAAQGAMVAAQHAHDAV